MTRRRTIAADARAFTLVEVMLAAFIIAIGMVGLLALFAGAAAQQQSASLVTQSVISTRNAQAMVVRNFGQLTAPPNCNTLQGLAPGVWYGLPMHPSSHYLTVNPRRNQCGLYFLVPAPDAPRTLYTVADPMMAQGQAGFLNAPTGIFQALLDLGQRRIEPATLVFEVVTNDTVAPNARTLRYVRSQPQTPNPIPDGGGRFAYYNSAGAPDMNDYIRVDSQESLDGTRPAEIISMNIADVAGTRYIESITAYDFSYRNDQLVSLSDRLNFRADSTAPEGRRPEMGYSLLYRRTPTSAQIAAFTYRLTAPSASAEWVPPERMEDLAAHNSPLRRARVDLGYDSTTKEYYFELLAGDTETGRWAVQTGQVLLVEGSENQSNPIPLPTQLGSDLPVTVTRQALVNRLWRGYVDQAPRASGVSQLEPERRVAGTKQRLSVWGVADVARSRKDGSLWRLSPLEARIIQVPNP